MSEEPPRIVAPLKVNNKTIGDIVINPDGSFEGRIHDRLTHVLWVAYLVYGVSTSMLICPNLTPAIEGDAKIGK